MTQAQAQAIERGYTHFIEVWRGEDDEEGVNIGENEVFDITSLDNHIISTNTKLYLYTVCIFLIKPKQ